METIENLFGTTKDGLPVEVFTLRNQWGMELSCISYGCRITSLLVPGKGVLPVNVVQAFDSLAAYEADGAGHGSLIGRYANRIAGASFTLEGKSYRLLQNEGENYLHGSLAHRVFKGQMLGENSVSLTYTSPDGEDGFPGELWVAVTYTLTDQNELILDYRAHSTADTHVNLTNHSYFNLAGQGRIEDHLLKLNSAAILEVDKALLPTGAILPVAGTPFDFNEEKPVGQDIDAQDAQLALGGGYDHCYLLEKKGPGLIKAACLTDPASGRSMGVYTTLPAIQLYTANMGPQPEEAPLGKGGQPLARRTALCLETQRYPDSPNHPEFPSTLLRAGEKLHEITALQFSWK